MTGRLSTASQGNFGVTEGAVDSLGGNFPVTGGAVDSLEGNFGVTGRLSTASRAILE